MSTNADRGARKRVLESRIALYQQMETLCYEEAQKLQPELQKIEDAEAEEEEREWNARMARRA